MRRGPTILFLSLITTFASLSAFAGAAITYHGRLVDGDDKAVETAGVTFKIQIRSPGTPNCLLYEETRTISMLGSNGVFVIPIGDGQGLRTANDPGITIERVFSNNSSLNHAGLTCNSGSSYQPQALDSRKLLMTFNDGTGSGDQSLPPMDINYVPLALNAMEAVSAQKVGTLEAAQVMSVASGSVTPLSAANFAELLLLVNGTSTTYLKTSSLPSCAAGQVLKSSGGAFACVTDATGTDTLAGLSCADGKILKRSSGAWTCADESGVGSESDPTVQAYAKVAPGAGLTVSGGAIVPDFGSSAGKVVQGNDARLTDSRPPNGSAAGDLSGSYPNPTVKGIRGNAVNATTPADGQVYKWATTEFQPKYIGIADLRKSDGSPQVPGCSSNANETLIWISASDAFSCVAINNLDASKVTGGTLAYARLPVGTTASTVAAGDDSRFGDALKIAGTSLSISSLTNGQFLKYDGTSWVNAAPSTVATELSGLATTGLVQRTGTATYSTVGASAPITNSGTNIGLAVGSGLTLNSGNLVPDFGSASGKVAQGNDVRFPSTTCASGNIMRWDGSAWQCEAAPTAGGSFSFVAITSNTTATAGNSYVADSASRLDVTLPATCSFGQQIQISGINTGGWRARASGSMTITDASGNQTPANGSMNSVSATSSATLTCVRANSAWLVTAQTVAHTTAASIIVLNSGTSWTVPANWQSSGSTIEVIGAGGGGGGGANNNNGSGGGGGGYAKISNASLTPGATITYSIGTGGTTNVAGTDTFFCNSTSNCASIVGTAVVVGAKGGSPGGASTGAAGGAGGVGASGVGSVLYSGGAGAASASGRSGGGAAGPNGNGNAGNSNGNGGSGDAGFGGAGGATAVPGNPGASGTEWTSAGSGGGGGACSSGTNAGGNGGNYGGGGGSSCQQGAGGTGGGGVIVIKYYP